MSMRRMSRYWYVIFYDEGGPIRIKFRRLMQNDMSTAKPDVELQYGGRLGEFNGMSSEGHVSHCRCCHLVNSLSRFQSHIHIAGCKNSIRHIENRFSPYFIFLFFNAV